MRCARAPPEDNVLEVLLAHPTELMGLVGAEGVARGERRGSR